MPSKPSTTLRFFPERLGLTDPSWFFTLSPNVTMGSPIGTVATLPRKSLVT